MNKLITALQRLYFLDDQQWHSQQLDDRGAPAYQAAGTLTPEIVARSLAGEATLALDPVGPDGMTRAMVVSFKRASDWAAVAKLYQAVQEDLDLPAPAISISGRAGYRLWFSLAEPVPAARAENFLNALRRNYLADIPPAHLAFRPATERPATLAPAIVTLVPALHQATGKWSAFIDPSLGSMFIDEPGLEMAPGMDKQASILGAVKSIKAAEFQRAMDLLEAQSAADTPSGVSSPEQSANFPDETAGAAEPARSTLNVGQYYSDPQSFLLAVMNDASASAGQRIEAAKALLPYFARATPE